MLQLTSFAGEIPKLTPRLLPDGYARMAKNCKLVNGAIAPFRLPKTYRETASTTKTFYKRGSVWFEWAALVDVVAAPIADNRLYVTGDGAPKMIVDSSTVYPLAVPTPASALTATVTGTPDSDTQESYLYTYTYVTLYDEESEPAPASSEVLRSPGMDVSITGFIAPPTGRAINRYRLYRSQTSATGATEFYFIDEQLLPVPSTYVDTVEGNPIQEIVPSLSYNPPPDTLQGIIALPNGIMAAFDGKKVYFSEPYIPHAWPEKYVLTTNYNIVALGVFGQSIAVLTEGNPYVITGTTPDAMIMERLEVNYPCVAKRSVVDLGYSVAYASTDGLVVISGQGAQLVSRKLINRDDWVKMAPASFICSQYDGRYMVNYDYVDHDGNEQKGLLSLDLSGEQPFISRLDLFSDFMFFEIGAGLLYLKSGQTVTIFDAPLQPFMQMTWRSKTFAHTGGINYGAILVDAEDISDVAQTGLPELSIAAGTLVNATFPTSDSGLAGDLAPPTGLTINVYSDGIKTTSLTTVNSVQRLTSGFLARFWEIEFVGTLQINAALLAGAPHELAIGLHGAQQ
ncbi:hypothetical protein GJ654_10450 [Rhodoblastus acidophilus]|uniref:Uncharacterized protein n=1 Tax=Rhodoblastus acidophilus TaxID=1074 RepID=A0A6N8DRH0_RHOAC|nr:hypothetical protein [Rhodoblastus acidophilus]MCW2275146.1 hypothetical protein [Rhodoblastus acidophilus]MTV31414.1 hypothetical protein [Rhodoblastus acidophilus]